MQADAELSLSPSFSSYSNRKIAEIAARAVDEFESDEFSDEFYFEEKENSIDRRGGEDEEEFEFAIAIAASDSKFPPQTSPGEIFQNGKIRPVYSVFGRDFSVKFQNEFEKENSVVRASVSPKIRLPLRKLFQEERETSMTTTSSSSSSEGEELDGIPVVNYCVWPPTAAVVAEEKSRCKKSCSVGCNSKRWKLRDFLHRSNSNGRENNVVVSKENEKKFTDTPADGGKVKPCNLNDGEKQRSYLPYRYDLAGLFGDADALRKKLESF